MENQIRTKDFREPYPQAELGGALGLTSEDIAEAIEIPHRQLVRDLSRRNWAAALKKHGFLVVPKSTTGILLGKKVSGVGCGYVLDIDASKAVLAQSRTIWGIRYLRYLLDCERRFKAAEIIIPALQAKIEDLTQELAEATRQPIRVRGKPRKHAVVSGVQMSTSPLFGDEVAIPVCRKLLHVEMTDDERRTWTAQHLSKISTGNTRKITQLLNHEIKPQAIAAKQKQLEMAT